jgi:diguanylate cyclase
MFTSGLTSVEAWLIGLSVLSLIGLGVIVWLALREHAPAAAISQAELETAAAQLDSEAGTVLDLVCSYVEAGERYSVTLAQAGRDLPKLATPEEVGIIVKFLLAANAKMQHEAGELKKSLEASKSQIDRLRSHLAEAQAMGMRDPLTSLSNRRHFDSILASELADAHARGAPLSLVMSDIDNFKKINDQFGHQIGDEILKTFARVLTDNVHTRDTVARYGGEEFAVILPETRLESARQLTERMRGQVEGMQLAVSENGQEIGKITASFGIAELGPTDDPDTLLHRADARLYEAKCAGRNRVATDEAAAA